MEAMDTSTFYVNGRFQQSAYPLDPEGAKEKLTTEGTESTEKTVRGCPFSVISVTSVVSALFRLRPYRAVVMLFGCDSAALREPFVKCVSDGSGAKKSS